MNEETKFKTKVLKFLKTLPGLKWIYKTSDKFATGIPDILFLYEGTLLAIELKVNSNPLSEMQIYQLERINLAGGNTYILHPDNFEEFKEEIQDLPDWF